MEPGKSFIDRLNPASLETLTGCPVEPGLATVDPGTQIQFERIGYFVIDAIDTRPGKLVFNRTFYLRDSLAKISGKHL